MALFLGLGTGGVFAWVARLTPAARVGTVAGIVGAAGGLGGYFPPLIMGETYDAADNNYTDRAARAVRTGRRRVPVHPVRAAPPAQAGDRGPEHGVTPAPPAGRGVRPNGRLRPRPALADALGMRIVGRRLAPPERRPRRERRRHGVGRRRPTVRQDVGRASAADQPVSVGWRWDPPASG